MAEFEGIANASGAVALDAEHFVVADDEERFFAVYRYDQQKPVGQPDLQKILCRTLDKEADLEGAARIGNTIFWIGSHGTDGSGNLAPDRQMLFATTFVQTGEKFKFELEGKIYRKLLDDMQAHATLRKVFHLPAIRRIPPKEEGGLAIEGLAATPDGGLIVGFRNPLVHGLAIVLEIANPFDIVKGQAPKFRQPVFIDLDGRGIRDITLLPAGAGEANAGYLIAGGPFGIDDEPAPALFHWSGEPRDRPKKLNSRWPADFNPEALFLTTDNKKIWVLSDDGKFWRGRDKRPDPKTFRVETHDLARILSSG